MSVFWWLELDLFSPECIEMFSSSFGLSLGLVWLQATHLLMFRVVFLFCWRISVVCLPVEFVGSCVELGFSVGVKTSR